jgi:hypothetical protein
MNNCFAFNREMEYELKRDISPRILGACLSVMRYMAIHANHTPGTYLGGVVGRGEMVTSVENLEKETGLKTKTLRNVLKALKGANKVADKGAIKGANTPTLYHIVNYDGWDAFSAKEAIKRANKGADKGATSKEEVKEEKERSTSTPPTPPSAPQQGGVEKEGDSSEEKKPELIVLPFRKAPAREFRSRLADLGFRYHDDERPPAWIAPWSEQREAVALEVEPLLIAPEERPKFIERTTEPIPDLPPTDPRLQPVLAQLKANLPPSVFQNWFNAQVASLEISGKDVIYWTFSKEGAAAAEKLHHQTLQDAFKALNKHPDHIHFRSPDSAG